MGSYYSEYFSSSIDSVAVDIFVYKYFALMREVVWYRIYSKRWKAELELVNTESFSRSSQSETISLQPTPGQIFIWLWTLSCFPSLCLSLFFSLSFPWWWRTIWLALVLNPDSSDLRDISQGSSESPSHLAETGKTVCFLVPWAGPFTSVYPIKMMGVGRG